MFSAAAITPTMLIGRLMSDAAYSAPNTERHPHIELHLIHFGAGFQADAAGVKGDAFSDQTVGARFGSCA